MKRCVARLVHDENDSTPVLVTIDDLVLLRQNGALCVEDLCYSYRPSIESSYRSIFDAFFVQNIWESRNNFTVVCFSDDDSVMYSMSRLFLSEMLEHQKTGLFVSIDKSEEFTCIPSLEEFSSRVPSSCRTLTFQLFHATLSFLQLPLSPSSQSLVVFSLNNQRASLTDLKLLPRRDFFFGNNAQISVFQEWKLDGRGGTDLGFGSAVYPAAVALSEYISRQAPRVFAQKRVLELGTGTGLCSIVIGKMFEPSLLVATDGDASTVQLARRNFRLNRLLDPSRFCCEKYLWGEDDKDKPWLNNIQVVVACDIVAVPYREHFPLLLRTLVRLKQQSCDPTDFFMLLGYTPRHLCEEEFFDQMRSEGFTLKRIEDVHEDFKNQDAVQLFEIH